jgi:predicted nucleotidyltransferase
MSEDVRNEPDDAVLESCRRILREHDVSTALLFGSAADPDRAEWRDLDIVVEFATDRPGDDGYSATYLGLLTDLDDALDADVDVVDVHTASPSFVGVALENGRLLVGDEQRRRELLDELGDEPPTVEDARQRVADAANRLRQGTHGG